MSNPTRRPAPPAGPPTQPALFDLDAGVAAKQAGVARAAAGADPVWRETAYRVLRALARSRREVHVDDFYAACPWHPARPNAWAAVWQRALREGLLAKTGRTRPTRLPEKQAHDYPLYRSLAFRGGHGAAGARPVPGGPAGRPAAGARDDG